MNAQRVNGNSRSGQKQPGDCWTEDFYPFMNVSAPLRSELVARAQPMWFPGGSLVFDDGGSGKGVYFVKDGKVKLSKNGGKKDFIFRFVNAGGMIGLESFCGGEPFRFTATAIEDVTAYFLPSADLENILRREPEVTARVIKSVCDLVDLMETRLTSISRKKLRAECAEVLLIIAKSHEGRPSGEHIAIEYGIEDLASLVGTTRNYLYKIMLQFADEQVLTIHKRKVIINEVEALYRISKER